MKNKTIYLTLLFVLFFSEILRAKDIYDLPEIQPITNQLYPYGSELDFKMSYFPIGAFNKYLGFGASYLKMYTPTQGWEVLTGLYFLELPSGLKSSVINSFGAKPEDFAVLKYLIKTGYTYVPFYSKSILFNSQLIYSRTYLNISAGASDYQIEKPPLISVGYGQNFYFGQNMGTKFEIDYTHFFKKNSYIQDQLVISFGWVLSWGGNE